MRPHPRPCLSSCGIKPFKNPFFCRLNFWSGLRSVIPSSSSFVSYVLAIYRQRGSRYPFDLIQLWEDHRFISRLAKYLDNLGRTDTRDVATFNFDPIYATILSNHPSLVLVLTGRALGLELRDILVVLGLSYNVLRPFLEIHELLESPLAHKDSPVYFLADPSRSGGFEWVFNILSHLTVKCDTSAENIFTFSIFETTRILYKFNAPLEFGFHQYLTPLRSVKVQHQMDFTGNFYANQVAPGIGFIVYTLHSESNL